MSARALGQHVVIVGPTPEATATVGKGLAAALGRPFVDASGAKDGFGDLERELALERGELAVVAASPEVADDVRRLAALVDTAVSVAVSSGSGGQRDRERAEQCAGFAELSVELDTADPTAAVDRIVHHLRRRIEVSLGERSYPVLIGPGTRFDVAQLLPERARRAAVVTQPGIGVAVELSIPTEVFVIPDGEGAKSLQVVGSLASGFARFGLTREDVVIAVGGGTVTDVAGFAAASYHRGTAVVHVATTLLGQIDAAIGGKTGVNIPEGKNLVGAFWQPRGVICDTDVLESMPARERRSGLGEMAKYAFLGVENLDGLSIVDQVAECVAAKARVVAADERESDLRMTLNYGHTLAHALEAAGFADGEGRSGVDLRHGEAVAIGLVFAARLAHLLGRIDADRVERHIELVTSYGLPTTIPAVVDVDEAVRAMGRDKKATDGLTFVLDGPNGVEVVRGIAAETIKAAFAETTEAARGSQ
jgi:5-deoxy-5-amino-3-dehydroquinate synthase